MKLGNITNLEILALTENATELFRLNKYKDKKFVEDYIGLGIHHSGYYGSYNTSTDETYALPISKTNFNSAQDVELLIEGVVTVSSAPVNTGSGNINYRGRGLLELPDHTIIYNGAGISSWGSISGTITDQTDLVNYVNNEIASGTAPLDTRVTTLEDARYQITYYEAVDISAATTGTISFPAGATLNETSLQAYDNSVLLETDGTGDVLQEVVIKNGVAIDSTLDSAGNWTVTDTYATPVVLAFVVDIAAVDYAAWTSVELDKVLDLSLQGDITNIYNSDDTLTGNRLVGGANFSLDLGFTGNELGAFKVRTLDSDLNIRSQSSSSADAYSQIDMPYNGRFILTRQALNTTYSRIYLDNGTSEWSVRAGASVVSTTINQGVYKIRGSLTTFTTDYGLSLDPTTNASSRLYFFDSYVDITEANGLVISDANSGLGLGYNNPSVDFANVVWNTDVNKIPHIDEVSKHIGLQEVNALVTTPTIAEDLKPIVWDNTANEYTFGSPTLYDADDTLTGNRQLLGGGFSLDLGFSGNEVAGLTSYSKDGDIVFNASNTSDATFRSLTLPSADSPLILLSQSTASVYSRLSTRSNTNLLQSNSGTNLGQVQTTPTEASLLFYSSSSTDFTGIIANKNASIRVLDQNSGKGMIYDDTSVDEANVVYNTDLGHIPSIKLISEHIGLQEVNSLVVTPTVAEDTLPIVWDNTSGEYALQQLQESAYANDSITNQKIATNAVQQLQISNNSCTNAKLANMAPFSIKGNISASTVDPQDLTVSQTRTLLNIDTEIVAITANYTMTQTASDYAGRTLRLYNRSGSNWTITPDGADTIEGLGVVTIFDGETFDMIPDGTNWIL